MNCRRVKQLLSNHLDARLVEREAGVVAAHLQGCPACRRRRDAFVATDTALRELPELPISPELRRRAVEHWIAERQAPATHGRLRSLVLSLSPPARRASLGTAAAAVLLLLLALARWTPGTVSDPAGIQTTQRPSHVRTARPSLVQPHLNPMPPQVAQGLSAPAGAPTLSRPFPIQPQASRVARRTEDLGSPASRHQAPLPAGGDLASLNGEHTDDTLGWALPRAEDGDPIEARLRREVHVRDDFVRIPLPRLADATGRQIVAAVESYQREAAVIDTRLSRAVTVQQKATALADLCDRLRADTGIVLTAGSSVADEKVTLFCEKLPLRDVMRQLSRPFGYTWLRSRLPAKAPTRGAPTGLPAPSSPLPAEAGPAFAGSRSEAAYRYELVQDLRSQLMEEELRNRDRNSALLALDWEMQRYRRYLHLSPDEALAASRGASGDEKELLERYAGNGWGPIQMYFRLSPRQLAILRAGQSLRFSAEPGEGSGEQPLPPDLARGVLQCQRHRRVYQSDGKYQISNEREHPEGLLLTAIPEARGFVMLQIQQSELGQFTCTGGTGSFISQRSSTPGTWYLLSGARDLGVGMSPSVVDPKNGNVNAKLSRDPALQRRTTLRPQASSRLAPEPQPIRAAGSKAGKTVPKETSISEGEPEPRVTTADVLEALHQATGRPIIADYYTRLYPPAELSVQNLTLFDALNHLADRMRLRWNKEGEWLQFRSTSYFHDRTKEVPNRLLTRWSNSRKQHGALTLDDLIEIAQLSDAQLDASGTAEGARAQYGLEEWVLPRMENLRDQLRFLSEFTPDQRRQAQTSDGLLFSRMTLAQQRGYLARAFYDGQNPHLDDLGNAILNVDYRLPGWFRWSPPGRWHGFLPPPVRERTREAALQAARRIDPGVEEAQIVATQIDLVFLYTANRQDDPRVDSTGPRGWFSER